ncbi:hypothetical protein AB0F52_27690 [Amycolatopsis sp. NPDC024027]|uniref:hypothetical protein n=1 Tax=Amycolatopsis sp. NPDC024027 TaxID=3154327 RepID=UPI0033DC8908
MPTAFQKELVTLAHRLADLCDLVAIALEEPLGRCWKVTTRWADVRGSKGRR